MKLKKLVLPLGSVLLLALLAGAWCWQFFSLNRFYWELSGQKTNIYPFQEIVWFENDYVDKDLQCQGYGIRVDSFSIQDYQSYMNDNCFSIPQEGQLPEKIALVTVTLFNDSSTAPGVMLPELTLHGIDSYSLVDWEILWAANPVLNNKLGIRLAPGSQRQLVLPFPLSKKLYSGSTWKNLDDYAFYLRITSYPTAKDLCVTP